MAISNLAAKNEIVPLKANKTVLLEEKENTYIKGVASSSISPKGDKIAFVDASRMFFYLCNTESGKIIATFKSSDTLNRCYTSKKDDYIKADPYKNHKVLDNSTAVILTGLDLNLIINDFASIKFLNDSALLVGGTIRALGVNSDAEDKQLILNTAGYYIFNDHCNLLKSSPFQTTSYEYSLSDNLFPYNDSLYLVSVRSYNTENQDSMAVFSLFDSEGRHSHLVTKLPGDYVKNNFKYSMLISPLICKAGGKFFWTTMRDYKIRSVFDSSSFELKGFDTTNFFFWLDYKMVLDERKKGIQNSARVQLRQVVSELGVWKDSLIAVHMYQKGGHIQFYDVKGNLKKHFILEPPEKQSIVKVAFASQVNKIFAVTKDEENYYLTEYIVK